MNHHEFSGVQAFSAAKKLCPNNDAETNPFAPRKYVEATGHHNFGMNFRPIDFDGWFTRNPKNDATSLSFWLCYWVAAYRFLLQKKNGFIFLSYDTLCKMQKNAFRKLAKEIGSENIEALEASSALIRSLQDLEVNTQSIPLSLIQTISELHEELLAEALHYPL